MGMCLPCSRKLFRCAEVACVNDPVADCFRFAKIEHAAWCPLEPPLLEWVLLVDATDDFRP